MIRQPAIRTRGLTKTFGRGALAVDVLKGIDLDVAPGEVLMLVGPSGSGKTTLLSIIGCVLSPSSGSVQLGGEEVAGLKESELPEVRLRSIGFVFQGHNLISALTAAQNIVFQLELRGMSRREARREAERLLERVGLAEKKDRKPHELSGGQRQRIAIARAVAGSPPLLLADEPTASLDARSGLIVTEMLAELARESGRTVVVVTHDSRIFHLADRIIDLEDGRLVRR